jgi:hypothetical protein
MRAYPLGGEVGGGLALEFESFLGPVKWHRADRRVPFGTQKLENPRAQPPPTSPPNGYARIRGKVGSGRGRSEGAVLEGENNRGGGMEGLKPMCECDGGGGGGGWPCG